MPPACKSTTTTTFKNLLRILRQLETFSTDVESKLILSFVEPKRPFQMLTEIGCERDKESRLWLAQLRYFIQNALNGYTYAQSVLESGKPLLNKPSYQPSKTKGDRKLTSPFSIQETKPLKHNIKKKELLKTYQNGQASGAHFVRKTVLASNGRSTTQRYYQKNKLANYDCAKTVSEIIIIPRTANYRENNATFAENHITLLFVNATLQQKPKRSTAFGLGLTIGYPQQTSPH